MNTTDAKVKCTPVNTDVELKLRNLRAKKIKLLQTRLSDAERALKTLQALLSGPPEHQIEHELNVIQQEELDHLLALEDLKLQKLELQNLRSIGGDAQSVARVVRPKGPKMSHSEAMDDVFTTIPETLRLLAQ